MRRSQRGASGIFVAIVLLLVAAAALAVFGLSRSTADVERNKQYAERFRNIQDALTQFVTANGRLPCPADPGASSGDAVPDAPAVACTFPAGTVPWKTVGLRSDDALDPWGNKISYRAFSGATGLTQASGASMVNCDTNEPSPFGADAAGLCRTTQDTTEAQFLAGKGLTLNNFGTVVNDAAYVLVSHGASGLGAFTSAGLQKPAPANAAEMANTTATGPFIEQTASTPDVGPEAVGHFDDLLAYGSLGDLVRRAGLGGRDWPDVPPVAGVKIDLPTMTAALGTTPSYGDLGTPFIAFSGATVIGADIGGIQNLSYENSGGLDGLGVNGSMISSTTSEFLILVFAQKAAKLAFTLDNFGFKDCGGNTCFERVTLAFFDGSTQIGTLTKTACNADGGLASFSIDASGAFGGQQFDGVIIQASPTSPPDTTTEFLLSAFASCSAASATCKTVLSDPTSACP